MIWINRYNELEEQYQPVLKYQEKMIDDIVEHFEPITKSIAEVSANFNPHTIHTSDIEITYDDDILVDGRLYTITEGLWTLITESNPDPHLYDTADFIE